MDKYNYRTFLSHSKHIFSSSSMISSLRTNNFSPNKFNPIYHQLVHYLPHLLQFIPIISIVIITMHHLHHLYSTVVIHYSHRVLKMNRMKIIYLHLNSIKISNVHEKHQMSSNIQLRVVMMNIQTNSSIVMINKLKSMNVKLNVYSNVFIVKLFSKISPCTVHINNYIILLTIHFDVHNVENKKQINTIFLYMLLNKLMN